MPSVRASIAVLAMAILGMVSHVFGGILRLVAGVASAVWSVGVLLAIVVAVRLGEVVERVRQPR